jgi:hypothetical protein
METPNPKCNRCKCYWKPDETDIKPSGLYAVSCKKCRIYQKMIREKNKCEHDRKKSHCKDCGGSQICKHDRYKSICKECGGGSICPHDRIKSKCRDCGGGSICEHDRRKSECRDCGGGSICEHDRRKSHCKICNFKICLVNLQRVNLKRCLKLSNLKKTKPSIEYLGCSAEYFIEYFKKKMDLFNQFSEIEMTWNNIHIDHIKPVSLFNLDDEDMFLSCCHYTNLQPLLAEINLNKSDKWSEKDEIFWNENIKDKEYMDIYLPI